MGETGDIESRFTPSGTPFFSPLFLIFDAMTPSTDVVGAVLFPYPYNTTCFDIPNRDQNLEIAEHIVMRFYMNHTTPEGCFVKHPKNDFPKSQIGLVIGEPHQIL